MLTLSLIIPVYNEEHHIEACLNAVSRQTVMPDQVIVVDNNCSDKTISIAKKFPFVTVIKEPTQGLIAARNTGFNSATSDILGRIDVDSIINTDWVETTIENFTVDTALMGLTGLGVTDPLPFESTVRSTIVSRAYLLYVESYFGIKILWGANTALRKSGWDQIKNKVTLDDHAVHEDQDISCLFAGHRLKIARDNKLLMTSTDRSLEYLPKFIEYDKRRVKTKKLHKSTGSLARDNKTVHNPIKIVSGLAVGNLFRLYFWVSGSIILGAEKFKKQL